ncbi:tenascin-X-like isoform X3 [Hemitrygon akajei]|uniref:tenascin-X-like isoform X3 n=1 Tax=Hemitrygon akajei TaxID=2704970 RepID=UPI003BFA1B1D
MEPALSVLILMLAASTLDVGDCSLYRTSIRTRRDVLANATSGRPTTFDHVYTIKLPGCRSCAADVSRPRARVFEARDEAPGDKQFEHVLDPTKPVVFTHRINIPPQACGCGDVQALHRRLQALEKEVANLRKQCSSGRCCGSGSAPDCGAHGSPSPSGCSCVCEEGWRGPTCAEPSCPPGCRPPRGECSGGRCVCRSGFTGPDCSQEACPDDCNDQGRCIDGRCVCFPGYTGHGCTEEEKAPCPGGCKGHGKCVGGKCICESGYSGPRCGVKACPNQCSNRGRCVSGKCACKDGFTGEDCSVGIPVALRLRMKKILETKATVEWDLPTDNVDAWVITFRPLKEEDGRLINKLGGSRTSFEQTGLASGQEYEVTLQAQKDQQLGAAVTRTFTTMIDSPQNLRVVSATNTTLELGWKKPLAAIDRYRLNYSSATGRRSQVVVPAGSSQTVLTGLEAGVEHTISLVGERGHHQSKAAATKGTTVIDSPRDLRTVAVTDSTISLQWERSVAQVDLYRISYTTRSGQGGELTVSGQDRTATLKGLEKGTKYTISLVGEQGKMKSEAVITTATTESLAHRELAGSHSSRPLAANGSQSIQDISKAISRKIAVAGLSADRDAMGHPAVRHHTALGRKPFRSPRVLLTTRPPKPLPTDDEKETEGRRSPGPKAQQQSLLGTGRLGSPGRRVIVSPGTKATPWGKDQHGGSPGRVSVPGGMIHRTRSPEPIPISKGKYRLVGFPGAHPRSRVRTPGIVPTRGKHGSPGSAPSPRGQNEPDLYPSLNRIPGTPLDGQQVSKGAENPPQSGRSETSPHGNPGEERNVEFETSSQISSKTRRPPLVHSPRHLIHQSSPEQTGPVVWNATSSCAQLSWEVAGGPFDQLVLAYQDSLTQVVQAKLVLRGNQQTANITGLIVGKSYDLFLYGSSLDHPLQPVNVTRFSVRGLDTGPVTANKESEDLQTMPADVQEEGVEEQEEEEDEDVDEEEMGQEEVGQEELEGEVTTPSTAGIPENTLRPSTPSENQTPWWTPAPFKDSLVTSQSFSTSGLFDVHGPRATPSPGVDYNAMLQTATDDTLSIPPTASTDQIVNFSDVLAREVKDRSLRLTWKVVGGTFDSFVVRYRETAGSAQWLERQVQGRYRSVLLKGLKAGTEYSLQLYGVHEGQRTEPYHLLVSTVFTKKIKTGTVGKLDTFVVSNITDVSFLLTWTTKVQFDSFLIHYGVEGSRDVQKVRVAGELRSSIITGLQPSTKYTLHLYGVSSGQRTKPITTTATTDRSTLRLGSLSIASVTSNSVRLSWTTDRTFDTFLIQYRVQGSQETRNITVAGGKRVYLIGDLRPSTRYIIYLYGISGSVQTQPLTTQVTTAAGEDKDAPSLVKLGTLSTSTITSNSVRLSWTTDRTVDTFLIQYRVQGSQETRNITVAGGKRVYLISGLRPSTRYIIHLYGISGSLQTQPLSTQVTTADPEDKDAPSLERLGTLSTPTVTSNSVRLSWTTDRTFDTFLIQYRVQGSQETRNITVAGGKRVYLISGLRPSTRYIIHLYGISGSLQTQPLTTQVTTTDPEDKDAPSPVRLGTLSTPTVTSNSVRLSWTTDRTFDTFLIQYRVQGSQETRNITVTGGKQVYLISSLRPSTRYIIHLYGISGSLQTQPLSIQVTTTDPEDKDAPSPVRLGTLSTPTVTSNSVRLSWTTDRTFDTFLIQYRVQGSQETRNITVASEKRVYLISGLRPSTRYIIHLYGISGSLQTQPLTTQVTTTALKERDQPIKIVKLDGLSFSDVTDVSFQLSWRAEKVFDSFLIVYGVQGSEVTRNLSVSGERRLVVITGLRPSTSYTVRVYGVSAAGLTKSLTTLVTTKATALKERDQPIKIVKLDGLSFSDVTDDSFQLSWRAEKVFDSFLIVYGVQGSEVTRNLSVSGERRLVVITGLRPSTTYTVRVYGVSAAGLTKSLTTLVTTKETSQVQPSKAIKLESLSFSNITTGSFRISWRAAKIFDTFFILYGVQGSDVMRNISVTGDRRFTVLTGLRPGTTYTIRVYGVSASGHTEPITIIVTTKAPAEKSKAKPKKLGSLTATRVTTNSIRLSWTAERGFEAFLVRYKEHASGTTRNVTVSGDQRALTITELRPGTKYTVHVHGLVNGQRTKPLSRLITTPDPEDKDALAPTELGTLSPPTVTSNSVRLSWTTDRTFDTFLIQYRVQGSQETRNITVAGGKRVYLIGDLRPSTRYIIHLYGISGSVRTQPLTTQVTTEDPEDQEASAPMKLGSLSPPTVTSNSVRLSWTTDRTFDTFLIQYRVQGSQETRNITVTGGKQVYLIRGLRPSTRYIIHLYGISGSVQTQPLSTQITTTAPAAPMKLGTLSPPTVTSNSVRLSWTTDRTFDSFLIQYRVQGSQETRNITVTGGKQVYLIRGLRPSTRYIIHLYGISGSLQTQPLSTQITTTAPAAPMKLGTLSPPSITSNSVRLSWTTDRTFDTFLIQYRVQGSQETRNITVAGGKRVYIIGDLQPSTRYIIYLYGISGSVRTQPLSTQVTTEAGEDKDAPSLERLGTLSTPTVTSNSVHLTWTTDRTFDTFLIQYRVQGSQETRNITVAGGKQVYLISGLRPSTRYIIHLYGISGSLQTQPLSTQVTTTDPEDKDAPSPVRLGTLSTPTVTSNSVRLSWTTDRTFDTFLIQYRVQGSQETRNITVAGGKQVYLISGLHPSTRYIIHLYGISGSLQTQPLSTQVTTTDPEDKDAPSPVRLGTLSTPTVTSNSVRLSWTTDRTFDTFLIQYRVQGSQETRNITVAGGKRVYLISGLRPSTRYIIHLYGISGSLQTQPLSTQVTTTASEGPTAPVRLGTLSTPTVTSNSVRLSWTTDRTFDTFVIQYRVQGSQETQNITVAGGKRVYLISGLRPSTRYIIHLYGISGSLQTQPLSTQVTTTASEGPTAPVRLGTLSTPTVTSNSVRLSWTTDRTFDTFLIQYRVQGSQETQNITVAGGKRVYLISGLRPSTRYIIHLYGISGSLQTQPLSTQVTTTASEGPTAPVRLGTLSTPTVTSNSVRLSWTTDRTFDTFVIQYRVQGSQETQNITVAGGKRVYLISGLRPSTRYIIHLYGISGSLQTQPLTTQVTTTASTLMEGQKPMVVPTLDGVSVSRVTGHSLELSWEAGVSQETGVTGPSEKAELGGLSAMVESASSVRLSWEARKAFDSFVVQYRPEGTEDVRKVSVKGSTRSRTVTGLRPSSKYTFYLYGVSRGRHTKPISATVITKDTPVAASPARPGVSDITANSLQISWTVKHVYQFFLIQYRAHGSPGFQNLTVAADESSYSITNLRPSTKYIIYLYGVHEMLLTRLMALVATTAASIVQEGVRPGQPRALGSLSVSNITADSLELSWSARWRFDSFVIQYRAQGSERVQRVRVAGNRRSYIILGLQPSTKYTVYVHGASGGRRTDPLSIVISTTASVDTNGVRPSQLSKLIRLSGNNVTENSLQVHWAAERGFDSFVIQYGAEGSADTQNITAAGDQHTAFITGLKPATTYRVSLIGLSGNRRTRPLTTTVTTTVSRMVEQVKSIMFGSLSFSNITANSLQLSWEMDGTFDSFLIEYVAQGSDVRNNFTVAGDRRSAYITGLKPATNYTIYLYGVSRGKLSRPLEARLTIRAVPVHSTSISSLGGVSVSDVTSHGLRLSWTVEEGAFDSFLVRYADTKGRLASKEITASGDRRRITLTDLSPGTEYQLSLYGVLDGQETNAIPITALTAQERQNGMSFTDITDTSVTISWAAASEPVDTYKIFYVPTIQGDPRSRSVDGARTSITLSGLQPSTQYEVNLVPMRGRVESPPILGRFTTAPDPPSHLRAIDVSGTRAVLQWKPAAAPIDHYVVSYKAEGIPTVRRTVPSNSAELPLVGLRPRTVYTAEIHSVQGVRRSSLVRVSFTTVPVHIPFPKNCEEELSNGRTESNIVTLYLTGNKEQPIRVFCDMTTDGGGWIVFQRRMNGKLNFTRSWKDYVAGFGDLAAEHWLGLENLHQLTSQQRFELRVDLRAGEESVYATYDNFVVEDAAVKYRLGLGKYAGTAGNSLAYHRGSNFTTVDEDNDNSLTNCAVSYRGGWWYQNCHRVNLNGEYGNNKDHQGVNWFGWKGFEFSIPFAEMKMRPHRVDRRE